MALFYHIIGRFPAGFLPQNAKGPHAWGAAPSEDGF